MKAREMERDGVKFTVGDYSAENGESYLAFLDKVSESRKDGGMIHGGHIHFIQGKLSEEDDFCFLKAAISMVLDRVPSVWPLDLPELVQEEKVTELTAKQREAMIEMNKGLLIPISPHDVIRVIKAAREYEALKDSPAA